jgi:hypothetical protein
MRPCKTPPAFGRCQRLGSCQESTLYACWQGGAHRVHTGLHIARCVAHTTSAMWLHFDRGGRQSGDGVLACSVLELVCRHTSAAHSTCRDALLLAAGTRRQLGVGYAAGIYVVFKGPLRHTFAQAAQFSRKAGCPRVHSPDRQWLVQPGSTTVVTVCACCKLQQSLL